jgi:hypothetical protein
MPWKYHHGMPFCIVTITVSRCQSAGSRSTSGSTWWAFVARITTSCGPASAGLATARSACVVDVPSASCSRRPFACSARKVLPRATSVTRASPPASRAATKLPIDPAPTMQMRTASPRGAAAKTGALEED